MNQRFRISVIGILTVMPLLALIWAVLRWHVEVPYWDGWLFAPFLEKSYQGTLSFKDLLASHNDSRPFFPRILMLGLARISQWDIRWELAANIVLAMGIFAVLALCLRRTSRQTQRSGILWLIPVVSLQLFSMNQTINWFKGLSIELLLSEGASVTSLAFLSRPTLRWPGFAMALAGGGVALFSFAGGAVCWPVGGVALFLNDFQGRPVRVWFRWIWCVAGLFLLALYIGFYRKPSHHPDLLFFISQPVSLIRCLLGYFGSPAGSLGFQRAMFIGAAGLLLWGMAVVGLGRLPQAPRGVWLPYHSIGLYALGNGVVTAIARVGFGERASLADRYLNMVNLFWLCLAVLLVLWGFYARDLAKTRMILWGLVLGMIASSLDGASEFPRIHARLAPAREELFTLKDDRVLKRLYPDVNRLKKWAAFLRSRKLSVYRDGA